MQPANLWCGVLVLSINVAIAELDLVFRAVWRIALAGYGLKTRRGDWFGGQAQAGASRAFRARMPRSSGETSLAGVALGRSSLTQTALNPRQPRETASESAASNVQPAVLASRLIVSITVGVTGAFWAFRIAVKSIQV